MIHISIEGIDGVGKTTLAKALANKLGYVFVEKPLMALFGGEKQYIDIRDKVNQSANRNYTAWFYGLSHLYLYESYKDKNIVTDRHFLSNYAWSGEDKENLDIFQLLLNKLSYPKLTVILYAKPKIILARLKERNPNDSDSSKIPQTKMVYEKMEFFCQRFKIPYIKLDNSTLSVEQCVDRILMDLYGKIHN